MAGILSPCSEAPAAPEKADVIEFSVIGREALEHRIRGKIKVNLPV